MKNIIEKWVKVDTLYPNNMNNSSKEKKYTNSTTNPIKLKCTKEKYRKVVNLRKNTFFAYFPKIPISEIMKIIELLIIGHKNEVVIKNVICAFFNIQTINIYKILGLVRHTIAHYLKEI